MMGGWSQKRWETKWAEEKQKKWGVKVGNNGIFSLKWGKLSFFLCFSLLFSFSFLIKNGSKGGWG